MRTHIYSHSTLLLADRGMALFTCILTPKHKPIQAVVCFCHGYMDHPTLTRRKELCRLVQQGIAVIMLEQAGHGRSDGALGLIENWDHVVDDTCDFFYQTLLEQERFSEKPCFLMGESMGGAVAYCTYRRLPTLFHRGVVLLCPMCKISEDLLPSPEIIRWFRRVVGRKEEPTTWLGFLPLAPSKGNAFAEYCCKDSKKFQLLSAFSPLEYGPRTKPRLATARELLDATRFITMDLSNFDAPVLIQHGLDDKITDPKLSQALYHESPSPDKTLKLYEGMWHSLIGGETDENVDLVLNDSIQWILDRASEKRN